MLTPKKSSKKLKILVSNDDGINSEGILALARALSRIAHVTVVAPEREQSTMGHALTLHKPVRIFHVASEKNLDLWATSGTPADCVYVGIRYVMKERPDFVISGINRGVNVGNDIYYSGTIAAAREGAVIDIPAIACSLDYHYEPGHSTPDSFGWAADYIVDLVKQLQKNPVPSNCLLNVNFPNVTKNKVKGVRVARQGFRIYTDKVASRLDNRGKKYFWLGGQYAGFKQIEGSDCEVLDQGYISITPFRIDLTQYDYLQKLSSWIPDPRTRKSSSKVSTLKNSKPRVIVDDPITKLASKKKKSASKKKPSTRKKSV
ncbi:MAG: 5'/3'-nucleotidase SurE [Bdellovibrionota bacterium]